MAPPDRPGDERSRFWKRSVQDEVDSELAFHVEMRTRELVTRGCEPGAARAAALARFGDLGAVNAECRDIANHRERDMRRTEYLTELFSDVRFALRQLGRARAFTVVAACTLALGVGATTAIFSAVEAVSLRPFPYAHADRLVFGFTHWSFGDGDVSAGDFDAWRQQTTTLEDLTAFQFLGMTVSSGSSPDRVVGAAASASAAALYGVKPKLGRWFAASEEQPGRNVAVLSEGYWRRAMAADSAVVGRTLVLNGAPYTIIGVMPAQFDPSDSQEQLWVPLQWTAAQRGDHDNRSLTVVARRRPAVSIAAAQREMDAISKRLAASFPQTNAMATGLIRDFSTTIVGDYRTRLFVLLGAVGCVLLIACGNVANLLLARGSARAKEIAVRSAIGAGRGRIVRQLLTESLVLSLLATVLGVGLAWVGIRLLVGTAPGGIPRLAEAGIDGGVLGFALFISVISSLVFGLVPALRAVRPNLQLALREGGRFAVASARDSVRTMLVVAEVTVAVTLLAGAGLLIRSAVYLDRVDPGFAPRGVLAARIAMPPVSDSGSATLRTREFERILNEVRARPGVGAAALTSSVPFAAGGNTSNGLVPEGRSTDQANRIDARIRVVTPGYFATMGIRLLRGHDFAATDVRGADRVMIISEALAKRAWPNENPIGKRVRCCESTPTDPMWKTVIGVARDVRSGGPATDVYPEFYLPLEQMPLEAWSWINSSLSVVARAPTGDAASLSPVVRSAVLSVDPTLPVFRVVTLDVALRQTLAESRFHLLLLTALGAIGLLLAAAGIYSVISYFVALRGPEIGVRVALGATPGDVVRMLTWQGLRPVLVGAVVGVGVAMWAGQLLRGSLFGVQPDDPITILFVTAALVVVALLAILVPARRALAVDPSAALHG
ncbi:MAG TPA: ABC transporter permease [Gemmatimonadaceae bacterium]|nr:ABC transporter permease [Gemmatimonadaceae bacterium]